jgi:hypothetical protein
MKNTCSASTPDDGVSAHNQKPEFTPYTTAQKTAWAKARASENAEHLSNFLGYPVYSGLPHVLLEGARRVSEAVTDRSILPVRICSRAEHYTSCIKLLCCAILNYDLASNLVGRRDQKTGIITRCDNNMFSELLGIKPRTLDNCIDSIKRSGLYLSFEQWESSEGENGQKIFRGIASIKRLNMTLFEMLGLGKLCSVQRAKAKQRAQLKKLQQTPAERSLNSYKTTDQKVRAKRKAQRDAKAIQRAAALQNGQSQNRTEQILEYMNANPGTTLDQARSLFLGLLHDEAPDIPY